MKPLASVLKQLTIFNCTVLEEETQLFDHPVRGFLICGDLVPSHWGFHIFPLSELLFLVLPPALYYHLI